jgi:hypothetical protein
MNKAITQHILIKAKPADVFSELIEWGESLWWPKHCLMKFINLSGEIKQGTVYLQKVKIPFGPSWHSRNEAIDKEKMYIIRILLDGIFSGLEELSVKTLNGNSKVIYNFNARVKGSLNRFLWRLVLQRLHMRNIDRILGALKRYLEKR